MREVHDSIVSGVARTFINPATLFQLATGPAGWASLLACAVIQQVASQVIQQIGHPLNLSLALTAAAQTAFSQSAGFTSIPGDQRQRREQRTGPGRRTQHPAQDQSQVEELLLQGALPRPQRHRTHVLPPQGLPPH